MAFELVSGLAAKDFVLDLKLCRVLFEDNKYYPWIFLVPMKENVKNMTALTMEERYQLMREIALAEKVMFKLFPCDQDNVAMIGNMTPQLHVHIVCRKNGDPDWPGTVWNSTTGKYDPAVKQELIAKIRNEMKAEMQNPIYEINQ
ncbi:MAG: HIT family protein [Alphaproteobacteria bacterium]|nr:HIT family protein [Alphaproteobacteria bacterium]